MHDAVKSHTKYAHTFGAGPILKDVECFPNFMRDQLIREHLLLNLSRITRRRIDEEPSRISKRTLKRLENESKEIREFVYGFLCTWRHGSPVAVRVSQDLYSSKSGSQMGI